MCAGGERGGGHHGASCCCPSGRVERFLEPCLLLLLLRKQAHGYELMNELGRFGFDPQNLDAGQVYRSLRRLEAEGMLESEWDTGESGPARRQYRVTSEGRELLDAWAVTIRQNVESLRKFLSAYEDLLEDLST